MTFTRKSIHLTSSISVMGLAVGLAFSPATTQQSLAQVSGAGASFPVPLYTQSGGWFPTYNSINGDFQNFTYVSTGSGAGVRAFLSQVEPSGVASPLSFAGTDLPVRVRNPNGSLPSVPTVTGTPNSGPPIQVPTVGGPVALAYNPTNLNVPAGGLRLSRATYCGILNGNITNWNNSRITADNGGTQLSANLPLRVVRRSDGSGTTYITAIHLNTVCTSPFNWNRGFGGTSVGVSSLPSTLAANTVYWPSSFLSGSGNTGVTSTITATVGAIGYAEDAVATSAALPRATLQNQAGRFVAPSAATALAALSGTLTDDDPDPRILTFNVPNPTATSAYPITGFTYLLLYDIYGGGSAGSSRAATIRNFIALLTKPTASASPYPGTFLDPIATSRRYVPLNPSLKTTVRNIVNRYVDTSAGR